MKKLILFLILYLPAPCLAFGPAIQAVIGGGSGGTPDGAIGSTGHSSSTTAYAARTYHTKRTPTTEGQVRYGHIYVVDGNGASVSINLYNAAGELLLCCSVTATDNTAGWYSCDGGETAVIAAATNYYLGSSTASTNTSMGYVASGGGGLWYDDVHSCAADINSEETLYDADATYPMVWDMNAGAPE